MQCRFLQVNLIALRMNRNSLLQAYTDLSPNLERLYVVPAIDRAARHNTYLQLLYKDLREGAPGFHVSSFSLLSPLIVLRRLFGEKSILHHHWFECDGVLSLLNCIWKILCVGVYRGVGGKVVWTIHNRYPHHGKLKGINRTLRWIWSRIAQRFHVHCSEAARIMQEELGIDSRKFFVTEHPVYPGLIIPKSEARTRLNEIYHLPHLEDSTQMFLMFGYIAPYKGIAEVIAAFRRVNSTGILCICGAVKKHGGEYLKEIRTAAGDDRRVFLLDKHIPEDQVPLFFNSADYVVFNYTDVLTSGGVALALSYGKQVIISRVGCLKELTGEAAFHFEGITELEEILRRLSTRASSA